MAEPKNSRDNFVADVNVSRNKERIVFVDNHQYLVLVLQYIEGDESDTSIELGLQNVLLLYVDAIMNDEDLPPNARHPCDASRAGSRGLWWGGVNRLFCFDQNEGKIRVLLCRVYIYYLILHAHVRFRRRSTLQPPSYSMFCAI